ncbi:MAG: Uma2 family endonuclease [Clostridiales bacterium]|jgi:Uma2 family endonuclease|nr:Uma2 family endonuclease [Clostridiales bacterium]
MSALRKEKRQGQYIYADYVAAKERGGRWELVDGTLRAMASPNMWHQEIAGNIHAGLWNHLRGNPKCIVLMNFDARLFADQGNEKAWQPDVFVVCDPSKKYLNYIKGAPDFVVEILSPSNTRHDLRVKLAKYKEARVREIWFIEPRMETITAYLLADDGGYSGRTYHIGDKIPINILQGLVFDVADIFETTSVQDEEDI